MKRRLAAAVIGWMLMIPPAAAPASGGLVSEPLARYEDESDLLATTPSTDAGALGAMFNPAQWGAFEQPEFAFFWSDANARPHTMDNWGFSAGRGAGISFRRHDLGAPAGHRRWDEWQLGFGGGNGAHFGGLGFGFQGAGKGLLRRANTITLGEISRPARWLSIGSATRFALGNDDIESVTDVGVRPLGTPRVLLFADYALRRREHWDGGAFAGGVALRPLPGLDAAVKLREGGALQLSLALTLNRSGARAMPRYDRDGDLGATRYVLRAGPPVRGLDAEGALMKNRRVLELDLKGRATYQSYRLFDEASRPLRATTQGIQAAIEDRTVAGVALSVSGYEANPAMLWEVRQKILALRRAGKTCVVYADRMDMPLYYLASAADRIVLDPMGMVLLPGVQASRTYMKDALAKLGLGFEEWRYYKYKSAAEALTRSSMSEADREQLGDYVRESYEELASGIATSGRMSRVTLDSLVDNSPVLTARRLLEHGWVDQLGHWEDVKDAAKALAGRPVLMAKRARTDRERFAPDEEWGEVPAVALVYAIGECAMETGIRGRATAKALRGFRERRDVKAVVMRADSPGGDALPSDLLAHELKQLRAKGKPALVSQGRVAASGGYWISMNADRITTTPFTITGSIGVIGGWIWNDGFGKKLGLTSDRVQAGRSADLLGGLDVPFIGAQIPERNLDPQEKEQAKRLIVEMYDEFTGRVAKARRLEEARVREIAEGRIWMGPAAARLGLVDRVGTLDETIEEAKRAAGIPRGRRVRVVEYPERGLFRMPWPRTLEAGVAQQIVDHPGLPLLLVPSDILPNEPEPVR